MGLGHILPMKLEKSNGGGKLKFNHPCLISIILNPKAIITTNISPIT
jgi:hypothetical protein